MLKDFQLIYFAIPSICTNFAKLKTNCKQSIG
jgi:hypothetical protein